jgi:hypothetical protein
MNILRAGMLSGLALACSSPGFADTFTSAAHRFSVNFPGSARQGETKDNEKDSDGNVLSRATDFQDVAPGRYMALLMADTYIKPYRMTTSGYIEPNVKNFLDGIKATATQKEATVDGYPAVEFSFDTADDTLQGKGIVVFVDEELPRGYMLIAAPLAGATADDKAKLDAFLASFDIK